MIGGLPGELEKEECSWTGMLFVKLAILNLARLDL